MNPPALARLALVADCARCGRLVAVEATKSFGDDTHRCLTCGGTVTRLRLVAGARG